MDWALYATTIMVPASDAATICARAQTDMVIPFAQDVRMYCRLRSGGAAGSSGIGTVPLALAVTGLVLAATGVVLVLVRGPRTSAQVTPVVSADGAGLWFTGRF
jgi:hypothetical protein